jgi:hypothetical protein
MNETIRLYYKHLKKGAHQSRFGRQKMDWFLTDYPVHKVTQNRNLDFNPEFSINLVCFFTQKTLFRELGIYNFVYGTSSQIVFVHFLGKLKTPRRHFEIN